MSVVTVAKKDLTSVRRSRMLWAVTTLLALLAAMIGYWYEGFQATPAETVNQLFNILSLILAVLLPIVALVASYLSIAGERGSGGIKFLLGFPNTRRDVFLGKLGSRLTLVGAGLGFVFLVVTSVASARHHVVPIRTVVGLFVVSFLYASVFVCIGVALSGAVATRSRAIAAAVGSYFVLVIAFIIPNIRITTIVRWLHQQLLGFESNPNLYDAITYVSPYVAFRKATNLVFPPAQQMQVFTRSGETNPQLPGYLSDEFSLVVFALWLAVPLVLGYLRFDRTDLK